MKTLLAGALALVAGRFGAGAPGSRARAVSQGVLSLWFCLANGSFVQGAAPEPTNAPGKAAPTAQTLAHVAVAKVNAGFIQNGGSCVLSSYAIVANYFTGAPITDYFAGYCRHFGLAFKDAAEAEQKYAAHFDAEWRKRNCRGYEVILDLHANSKEPCFAEARRTFEGRFYLDSAGHVDELEHLLSTREAFLNITYEPGRDYHSITIMNDGTRLMARDTNQKGVRPLPGLRDIGKLRDSVLYLRRADTSPSPR